MYINQALLDYYRDRATFQSINGAQAPDKVARELAAKIDQMVAVVPGKRS